MNYSEWRYWVRDAFNFLWSVFLLFVIVAFCGLVLFGLVAETNVLMDKREQSKDYRFEERK